MYSSKYITSKEITHMVPEIAVSNTKLFANI